MVLIILLVIGLGIYELLSKTKLLRVPNLKNFGFGKLLRHPVLSLGAIVDLVLWRQLQNETGFTSVLAFFTWFSYTGVYVIIFFFWWKKRKRERHVQAQNRRIEEERKWKAEQEEKVRRWKAEEADKERKWREEQAENERRWKAEQAQEQAEEQRRWEEEQDREERKRREEMRQAGIDEIDKMDGWEFEKRMEVHFEIMGWTVLRTPGSGDKGADLVLTTPDGRTVVIQCKRYNVPVGKDAVEEVLNGKLYYEADAAMVITNSHLTRGALDLAKANNVDVWEREELIRQLLAAKAEYDENDYEEEDDSELVPDCFRVLFFESTSVTEEEVLRRYRKLSTVAHPDAGGSDAAFVRLQNAKDECLEYLGRHLAQDVT
ncbi:restriction endonuclease [Alicyclobacillus tolerans]|uniref:restriction endonuclease n=1 Tax=Alicyclobacillus tolerans TaxID=90970 RepID=UPI001F02C89E|nr:restriction endonuclease [Alicyclobacillus tolerans]MCF8564996.1 restriction endonuclease [Alicyclobacillus tolerans]